jgi:choline dehydrogenase
MLVFTSAEPSTGVDANVLDDPADPKKHKICVNFVEPSATRCRFAKREIRPGPLDGPELEAFIRNATVSHFHQTCTAKRGGRDAMSVVAHCLGVYGINKLRIAGGSIMPRIVTGNTMAPCVVTGSAPARC